MADRPNNFLEVLLTAAGKGVEGAHKAYYEGESKKRQDFMAAWDMMNQQQQAQRQQAQMQMQQQESAANLQMINARTKALLQDMADTPEMKAAREYAQKEAMTRLAAQLEYDNRINVLKYAKENDITTSGNTPGGAGGAGANQATKLINPLVSLTNKNAEIGRGNAKMIGDFTTDSTYAKEYNLPIPPRPDTTSHINIDSVLGGIAPFVVGDSVSNLMFPGMGDQPDTTGGTSLAELEADFKAGNIDEATYKAWKAYLGGK